MKDMSKYFEKYQVNEINSLQKKEKELLEKANSEKIKEAESKIDSFIKTISEIISKEYKNIASSLQEKYRIDNSKCRYPDINSESPKKINNSLKEIICLLDKTLLQTIQKIEPNELCKILINTSDKE